MKGAGDEMVVTRQLLNHHSSSNEMTFVCSIFIIVVCVPPLIKAFRLHVRLNRYLLSLFQTPTYEKK